MVEINPVEKARKYELRSIICKYMAFIIPIAFILVIGLAFMHISANGYPYGSPERDNIFIFLTIYLFGSFIGGAIALIGFLYYDGEAFILINRASREKSKPFYDKGHSDYLYHRQYNPGTVDEYEISRYREGWSDAKSEVEFKAPRPRN